MLGKRDAIQKLKPSLNATLQKWMDEVCETDEWEALKIWVGENLAGFMGDAAMAVLEGIVDVHEYLKNEGIDFSE